ncbi:MAG: peptide chain release factor 2 [Syntrophomonadaceae bacterium]|nr:peptide chain release factor 2 [Syntrophomonadaceae bacterium]
MLLELRRDFNNLEKRLAELRVSLDVENCRQQIAKLEQKTLEPGFWEEREKAQQVLQSITFLKKRIELFEELQKRYQDLRDLWELCLDETEPDESLTREIIRSLKYLEKDLERGELEVLLSGPYDNKNAIMALHAGAGGTDAQDWVELLLRMYTRWAEEHNYRVEIMDLQPGEEAGLKSVTLLISGENAYGYLKSEKGVHRLVRISPFDSSGRRHTSFAAVEVLPEVSETVEVEIDPNDLRIDTYRSGGAGGQHVNKTDSAVRITHLPTGIVVQCQNERSQQMNRILAMKILQSRLFELEQRKKEEAMAELRGEYQEIAWGSQIRSYTFNPFSLVKDHRTNVEVGNVQGVMDGDLDPFIYAYLQKQARREF